MSRNKKKLERVPMSREEFNSKVAELEARQREFLMSDDYALSTTKMYTAYYLLSVAVNYIEDVYDILGKWGPTGMNSIRKELESMSAAFDRYDKKFRSKMLPKDSPQYAGRCDCIIDGFDELQAKCDEMVENTLNVGTQYMQYVRLRADIGHGCDTCAKFNTPHCIVSSNFKYPQETGCLGYQGHKSESKLQTKKETSTAICNSPFTEIKKKAQTNLQTKNEN